MTAQEIYNKHGKKAYKEFNEKLSCGETILFVDAAPWIIEAMNEYARLVAEKAVMEEREKWDDPHMGEDILSRIKTLTEE